MRAILFPFLFSLFLAGTSYAQVGLSAGAQFLQADEWETRLQEIYDSPNATVFSPTLYLGLDYWFRLKNKRIEFTPEIGYAAYSASFSVDRDPLLTENDTYKSNYFSLYLNTNFYLLDFGGDCNCPTFNKDGDLIKKGFFLRVSPGVVYNSLRQSFEGTSTSYEQDNVIFSLRAGLGLDIGLSPFLTITPLVMGVYNMPTTWNDFGPEVFTTGTPLSIESQVLQLFAGIRLGLRFDEINKYGYR